MKGVLFVWLSIWGKIIIVELALVNKKGSLLENSLAWYVCSNKYKGLSLTGEKIEKVKIHVLPFLKSVLVDFMFIGI